MRSFVLVVLAACEAGMIPATVDTTVAPIVGPDGRTYAVVHLIANAEECSNLGGEHDTLELDEPAHRLIHAGGHGEHLVGGATSYGMSAVPDRYYIAVLDQFGPVEIRDPGWCLDHLPHYDGHAQVLLPARDRADARSRLA